MPELDEAAFDRRQPHLPGVTDRPSSTMPDPVFLPD
jgi:hypothetical protein